MAMRMRDSLASLSAYSFSSVPPMLMSTLLHVQRGLSIDLGAQLEHDELDAAEDSLAEDLHWFLVDEHRIPVVIICAAPPIGIGTTADLRAVQRRRRLELVGVA